MKNDNLGFNKMDAGVYCYTKEKNDLFYFIEN
jgi:hypothetical protein